ncbi:sugar phosphate nucleotidyltransferase [Fulvivirgaceae bacterium BMA10]|uniref:glucose-1-phosphate thymidylyltransferase n=1 Tax=Splendidivirga corallicola TaxID=3051826 RepID=A0ABT8KUF2_9BACT|nr:sugar phosphate nucleotidyltransferase [Fulvivirgaceae bacterium BMA10]
MPDQSIIGIIPCGGNASRISPLPCSKEIYPIGFTDEKDPSKKRPKVVSSSLIDKMVEGGGAEIFMVIKKGKWDIPNYFGDGAAYGANIAYAVVEKPFGVPFTIDQVYPFTKNKIVLFGFPDILFSPKDAYRKLLMNYDNGDYDVILGLFPVREKHKWDMVKTNSSGEVIDIKMKPRETDFEYAWVIACWGSKFSSFNHQYCKEFLHKTDQKAINKNQQSTEFHLGHVFQEAIEKGLRVQSVIFDSGKCIDIGTPEDLLNVSGNTNMLNL